MELTPSQAVQAADAPLQAILLAYAHHKDTKVRDALEDWLEQHIADSIRRQDSSECKNLLEALSVALIRQRELCLQHIEAQQVPDMVAARLRLTSLMTLTRVLTKGFPQFTAETQP